MEKTYVELKVTFIHIVVMVVGVIVIGAFLFYLGYQAGQSSGEKDPDLIKSPDNTEEIRLSENSNKDKKQRPNAQAKKKEPSISDEIRLHQFPSSSQKKKKEPASKPKEKIKPKQVTRSRHYSIQVGAFSEQARAMAYANKFGEMGYTTEIVSGSSRKHKKLYKVRVGSYQDHAKALKEKNKLEKMEKKKFRVVKPD